LNRSEKEEIIYGEEIAALLGNTTILLD